MLVNPQIRQRPKYLNLPHIRLPLPGVVSILHRTSGALLFVALPVLLYGFQQSLASSAAFDALKAALGHWYVKIVVLILLWAYFHHLCAGLRHLALDLHLGIDLHAARLSSWLALIAGILMTLMAGTLLW